MHLWKTLVLNMKQTTECYIASALYAFYDKFKTHQLQEHLYIKVLVNYCTLKSTFDRKLFIRSIKL